MRRLALAGALAAMAILAFELARPEIGFAILLGIFVLSTASGIVWVLSPKFWRETTTVRFWVILVVLMLIGLAMARLR
jgi:hypothetical protein